MTFRQDYLLTLPLPLAQVYHRAYHEDTPRSRHDNAFYCAEALLKLMTAPLLMSYLHAIEHGNPRHPQLDQHLRHLALPALGHWWAIARSAGNYCASLPGHPLGHLAAQWQQRQQADLLALYQRIKHGPDGTPAGDRHCSIHDVLQALVAYRNKVFGHGAARPETFYQDMEPLLAAAASALLDSTLLQPLGPPGTRLVYVTAIHLRPGASAAVEVRDLVGMQGQRGASLHCPVDALGSLEEHCIAVLWPDATPPVRLDPLLTYQHTGPMPEVHFLNGNPTTQQVEYISYTTGQSRREERMASSMARLFQRLATQHAPAAALERPTMRVVMLYKRQAQPDEELLHLLVNHLQAQGHQVFLDRNMAIGMQWARELGTQIRQADAVIPLLSAASVSSEMLAWEVNVAHEAAQQQDGLPRLLPVRLHDPGPLPGELARVLDPLEYAQWNGPQDNQRLLDRLLYALQHPGEPIPSLPRQTLEWPAGAVPMDSQFYLERPTDTALHAAIARQDSLVLIKGARQMGKTSLLARGLHQARQRGWRVALSDFQKLNVSQLASLDTFYMALAGMLAGQLDLEVLPVDVWDARRAPNENFERYLRREVLTKVDTALVWGMDEVDRLFAYEFSSEVFGLLRAWHNERTYEPGGPWQRLTMVLAYATEAYLFITDLNQSPFNVGTRFTLEDFTLEQVTLLNQRHGAPLRTAAEVAQLFHLLGGQPYLVRRALHDMVEQGLSLAALAEQADQDEGLFGDHLRRLLVLLAQNDDLRHATREVLQGRPCPNVQHFHRLRSAGVLAGDSLQSARLRCLLYDSYVRRHL